MAATTDMNTTSTSNRQKNDRLFFVLKLILFSFLLYTEFGHSDLKNKLSIPQNVMSAVFFYIMTHLSVSFGRITIVRLYTRRGRSEQDRGNFLLGINQIANILGFIFLFFSVLILLKIDIRELFTSLSIIAAAIAILSKDYISNMINGMIIMFSNQYSLNDYVKIGSHKGRLLDISLANIQIKNDNGDIVLIPNNTFFNSDVINYTKHNIQEGKVEFEMKYSNLHTLSALEQGIWDALESLQEYILAGSAQLRPVDIKIDSALINFQYHLNNPVQDRHLEIEIRKRVLEAVIQHVKNSEK